MAREVSAGKTPPMKPTQVRRLVGQSYRSPERCTTIRRSPERCWIPPSWKASYRPLLMSRLHPHGEGEEPCRNVPRSMQNTKESRPGGVMDINSSTTNFSWYGASSTLLIPGIQIFLVQRLGTGILRQSYRQTGGRHSRYFWLPPTRSSRLGLSQRVCLRLLVEEARIYVTGM